MTVTTPMNSDERRKQKTQETIGESKRSKTNSITQCMFLSEFIYLSHVALLFLPRGMGTCSARRKSILIICMRRRRFDQIRTASNLQEFA